MNYIVHAEAIVFDLDGVIADTREMLTSVWQEWCTLRQVDLCEIKKFSHGRRAVDTIKIVAPHLDPVAEGKIIEELEYKNVHKLRQVEGITAFIDKIADLKWGVSTSTGKIAAKQKLIHAIGFKPAIVVTSEDVKCGKPDPEPYLKAAGLLRVAPENMVVFEDAAVGIQAAKRAGAKTIGVLALSSRENLQEADYIINNFNHLRVISTYENKITLLINS